MMQQLIQNFKTGELSVKDVPMPQINDKCVLVKNMASVISAGTEKTKVDLGKKSLLQKAKARPDLVKQVIQKAKTEGIMKTYKTVHHRLESAEPLGYSSAGVVEQVGALVTGVQPGDRVVCAGAGYANHAEYVAVPMHLVAKIPGDVDFSDAAFTTIAAIALQGVRLAEPKLGETFLVLGLGLVGQITLQLLKANGCQAVGYDLDPSQVDMAKRFEFLASADEAACLALCQALTADHGVDGVIICAGTTSNKPIEFAADVCRSKGRVICVGAVGLNIPRTPFFKKEINFMVSRSYGPGRYDPNYEENGIDYPYDYVRFSEQRNLETILQLIEQDKLNLAALITHRYDFCDAVEAYQLIQGEKTEKYVGILLEYAKTESVGEKLSLPLEHNHAEAVVGKVNLSCIGAGNYAVSNLFPYLTTQSSVVCHYLLSASGRSANQVANKFKFNGATNSLTDILGDHSDTVMITTRHDTHAAYVCHALEAGKHVYVEKPLALNRDELQAIAQHIEQQPTRQLMVGFNRRFAPLTQKILKFFDGVTAPKVIHIRVNAGMIPHTHWVCDPNIGGGRLIGEACHFVDLASCFAGGAPVSVYAKALAHQAQSPMTADNVCILLKFDNGSLATIHYLANGAKALKKEYLEVFAGGRVAVLEDFKKLKCYDQDKNVLTVKLKAQDKGQKAMLAAWLKGLQSGIPVLSSRLLLQESLATLAIVESLASGQEIHCLDA